MAYEALAASDYAALGKTDTATFFGMRLAMAEAALKVKSATVEDGRYAAHAKAALEEAIDKSAYLKGAGTQALVKSYFREVVDRQQNPDTAMKLFLDSVKVDPTLLADVRAGKDITDATLQTVGADFLKAANKHLGVKTLTEDFRSEISQKSKLTAGVTIEPSALSQNDVASLAKMEQTFRRLDAWDDQAFKVIGGLFGNAPAVAHLLAHTDAAVEKELSPILAAATRLREGKSAQPEADVQAIRSHAKALAGGHGDIAFPEHLTPEEARAIGEHTLKTVARMRAGDPSAGADTLLSVVETRGKPKPRDPQDLENHNPLAMVPVEHAAEKNGGMFSGMSFPPMVMMAIAAIVKALTSSDNGIVMSSQTVKAPEKPIGDIVAMLQQNGGRTTA